MPKLIRVSDTLEMIMHGQGTVEFRRGNIGVVVITFTELPKVMEYIGREIKNSRLKVLNDNELVVMDIALSEDEGNWHDEEKELIRQNLVDEFHEEVERRNLIPDE